MYYPKGEQVIYFVQNIIRLMLKSFVVIHLEHLIGQCCSYLFVHCEIERAGLASFRILGAVKVRDFVSLNR